MKERMQVQSMDSADPNKVYKNTLDGFRKILKNEGWRGLYKGYGATLGSFGPFSALYFMFYEKVQVFFVLNGRILRVDENLYTTIGYYEGCRLSSLTGLVIVVCFFLILKMHLVRLQLGQWHPFAQTHWI